MFLMVSNGEIISIWYLYNITTKRETRLVLSSLRFQIFWIAGDEKCIASGGNCQNRYSCNVSYNKIVTGRCSGGRDNICCVPKCVDAGGDCKHRSTCELSSNKIETGKCPGDRNNICCVPKDQESGRYLYFPSIFLILFNIC